MFRLGAQELQRGERGMGGHGASRWLSQHALAKEAELPQPGSLLPGCAPNKTSLPKQQQQLRQ